MNNSTFTFYDFVAAVIPGSIFLVGSSIFFDVGVMSDLLIPKEFGSLGVHLILAYATGQLLQVVGNWLEHLYWKKWKGMPTEWPITRGDNPTYPAIIKAVFSLCHQDLEKIDPKERLAHWQMDICSIRSNILANNSQGRIQVFNSLYGMFRGLFISFLLLVIIYVAVYRSISLPIGLSMVFMGLSLFNAHKFAKYYATELFSTILWIKNNQPVTCAENE